MNEDWESYKKSVRPGPRASRRPAPVKAEATSRSKAFIDGKLDLHGLTEAAAHRKLSEFVSTAFERGDKRLLVITGVGREGQSVLRANAPRWCETLPLAAYIGQVEGAARRHGGEGAFYILLKRRAK